MSTNDLTKAIIKRLKEDSYLTSVLSTYDGEPAVFSTEPVPEGAELPYVVSPPNFSDTFWDTHDHLGRRITRDVKVYTKAGSEALVEDIADEIYRLFHRQSFLIDNLKLVTCSVTNRVIAPTDWTVTGRILTLSILLQN